AYVYFENEPGRRSAVKSGLLRRLANLECAIRMVTALTAPIFARSDADNFPERLNAMALIAGPHSIRDFREGHFGTGQKLLDSAHSILQNIAVRRHTFSLLEDRVEMGGR